MNTPASVPTPIAVVLLEDDADDAALITSVLRRSQCPMEFDHITDEAHYCARLDASPPDVVVADYALSGYNGVAALEEVRRRGLDIPFILVTGVLADDVAAKCARLGASDYILKDRLARLPEAVLHALEQRQLRRDRTLVLAALRRSQQEYQLLFQTNPQPMFVFDVETLQFLAVNAAAEAEYGYAADEFLRMRLPALLPPQDVPEALRQIAQTDGKITPESGPVRHQRKDGTELWAELHSSPIHFEGRAARLVLLRDVTEQRHAEEARARAEAELEALVAESPHGIYRSAPGQDRFMKVNPALVRLLGYDSAEEVLRLSLRGDVYRVPEERERMIEAIRNDPHGSLEVEWKRKDGSVILVSLYVHIAYKPDGSVAYFDTVVEDVTERKRMQEALRASEERLRMAVSAGNVGLWELDLASGQVWTWPEQDIIFGYEQPPAWTYRLFLQHVVDEDRERIQRVLEEGRATGVVKAEFRIRALDGSIHWLAGKGQVQSDKAGKPVRMRGTIEDVSERRALEDQLRQAQKMEAIGRLAGGIAHDFNNLLMVMRGFAELLHEKIAGTPERHDTEKILEAADRAARLVGQLLAFSRKQVLAPQVLDLNECLAEVGKLLPRVLGEHIEVVLRPHPAVHAIKADPMQMEQVLMNLAINARDAMPHGGKLLIETQDAIIDDAHARRHPETTAGPYVMLAVSDTGCGMDAETSQHIFEPFFTTKREQGGTGLGLATVYGIVRQSGGFVWVYSEVGKGTTFKLYFPAVAGAAAPLSKVPQTTTATGGHETLLVVEDEEGVRTAMTEYLRRRGYNVLAAGNGADALQIAGGFRGDIDLLVTDVVMPAMSGQELARALLARHSQTRVLYVSGYTGAVLAEQLELGPTTAFLEKPFTWEAFGRKIREVLDHAAAAEDKEAMAMVG